MVNWQRIRHRWNWTDAAAGSPTPPGGGTHRDDHLFNPAVVPIRVTVIGATRSPLLTQVAWNPPHRQIL